MKKEIKKKLIVSLVTSLNFGFLFIIANPTSTQTTVDNLAQVTFNALILTLLVSLIYVFPIISIIGLPLSITIDHLVRNWVYKNAFSLILHIITGIFVTITLFYILSGFPRLDDLFVVEGYLKYIFVFVYPSVSFWIINYLTFDRGTR